MEIDAQTNAEVMTESVFGDYRKEGDIMIAHTLTTFQGQPGIHEAGHQQGDLQLEPGGLFLQDEQVMGMGGRRNQAAASRSTP